MQPGSLSLSSESIDVAPHLRLRQLVYAADLTREAATALRMAHAVAASAQMLVHRYYVQASLSTNAVVWVVGACLLLAGKAGNAPHSMRHVANVLYDRLTDRESIAQMITLEDGTKVRRVLDFYGAQGYDWKAGLLQMERRVLATLGFRLAADLPHKFVLVFINALREHAQAPNWDSPPPNSFHSLLQDAWNFANDALLVPTCAVERAEDVACACIALAADNIAYRIPPGWQVVFGSCASECGRIVEDIKLVYSLGDLPGTFVDYSRTDTFARFHPPSVDDRIQSDTLNGNQTPDVLIEFPRKRKRRRFADATE